MKVSNSWCGPYKPLFHRFLASTPLSCDKSFRFIDSKSLIQTPEVLTRFVLHLQFLQPDAEFHGIADLLLQVALLGVEFLLAVDDRPVLDHQLHVLGSQLLL